MSQVTPAQRLAAVIGKCFETKQAVTRTALRHAVYSKFVGREVSSSADLTDLEVKRMLERWESHVSPFLPSETAMRECPTLADSYQREKGQAEMVL